MDYYSVMVIRPRNGEDGGEDRRRRRAYATGREFYFSIL
jgi:hypothetical protein